MADGSVSPPDHCGKPDPEICRAAGTFRLVSHPARLQALILLEGGSRDAGRLAAELGLAGRDRLYVLVEPLVAAGMLSSRREAGKSLFSLTVSGIRLLEAFRLVAGPGPVLSTYAHAGDPESGGISPASPGGSAGAGDISASSLLGHTADPARLRLLLSLTEEGRDVGSLASGLGRTGRVLQSHAATLRAAGLAWTRADARDVVAGLTEVGLGLVQVLRAASSRLDAAGCGAPPCPEPDRAAGLKVLDPASADGLAGLLKVFADPVRLRLINLLAGDRSLCSCHLLDALDLPKRSIYESVSSLKKAGVLVEVPEEGWVTLRLARYARDLHRSLVVYLGPRLAEAATFRADRDRFRSLTPCPGPLAEGGDLGDSLPGRIRLA